jgi:hypothetical protein
MVLLQAITQDDRTAASRWADGLSSESLIAASTRLEQFPVQYRKAMLRRLGPERGAAIWTRHIVSYRAAHPELSAEQVNVLTSVLSLIKTDTFTFPTTEEREASKVLADRVRELFGEDAQRYLLIDLGPRKVQFMAQATPLRQRLQDFVREHFVVNAGDAGRCNCIDYWECDGAREMNSECKAAAASGCALDPLWPACGFLWLSTCDGKCTTLYIE